MAETPNQLRERLALLKQRYHNSKRGEMTKTKMKNIKDYIKALGKLIRYKENGKMERRGLVAAQRSLETAQKALEAAGGKVQKAAQEDFNRAIDAESKGSPDAKQLAINVKAIVEKIKSGQDFEDYTVVPKGRGKTNPRLTYIATYGEHDLCQRLQ